MTTELDTCPSFTFEQQNEYGIVESPIVVVYWRGSIELKQNGNSVLINSDTVDDLFKTIKKHRAQAERELEKKFK